VSGGGGLIGIFIWRGRLGFELAEALRHARIGMADNWTDRCRRLGPVRNEISHYTRGQNGDLLRKANHKC
jgi:hypothetical protein